MKPLLSLIAFAVFVSFVGILGWKVPEVDLLIVIAFATALVGYDLLTGNGKSGK